MLIHASPSHVRAKSNEAVLNSDEGRSFIVKGVEIGDEDRHSERPLQLGAAGRGTSLRYGDLVLRLVLEVARFMALA